MTNDHPFNSATPRQLTVRPRYCLVTIVINFLRMTLKQQIDADIKDAMRAKATDRLRALRAIKSMILLDETKEGASADGLSAEDEIKLLSKAMKQRKDSAEIYRAQGRDDLLATEEAEMSFIETYLPKQLTEDELKTRLQEIIARIGADKPGDMGKVMGVASKELAGLADGKAISAMVKALLA
jgi:uncharacterized protein